LSPQTLKPDYGPVAHCTTTLNTSAISSEDMFLPPKQFMRRFYQSRG